MNSIRFDKKKSPSTQLKSWNEFKGCELIKNTINIYYVSPILFSILTSTPQKKKKTLPPVLGYSWLVKKRLLLEGGYVICVAWLLAP